MKSRRNKSLKILSLHQLKNAFNISRQTNRIQSRDLNALMQEHAQALVTRRKFIGDTAKAAAVISIAGLYEACNPKNKVTQPQIVIVGAGIAGLHAAYILKNAGYTAHIYEGSPRAGGRIMSVNDMMGEGLWTEMGGEFIDTDHEDMINLAKKFDLPMLDRVVESEKSLKEFCYYFQGKHLTLEDVLKEIHPVAEKISADINSLSDEITFEKHTADDQRLDNMSIAGYIDSLGIKGWFRDFISSSYTAEYGLDISEQSAINFLSMFDPGDEQGYKLYGSSDERFSIVGGNQKLTDIIESRLSDQIHKEHILKAISQKESKKYSLSFQISSSSTTDVEADIVLLTLPFTALREVDIKLPLPDWKKNVIKNLGYGTNSKLFVGVNDRIWRNQGYTGYSFSDNIMSNGYDHTQMQNSNQGPGGFTIFLGGKTGLDCGSMDLGELQSQYVPALDQIYSGINDSFNGRFQRWHWPSYVFSKCSYTSYKVGQYTTLSGAAQKPVDNLFFAGEHCSYEFQGFMNGGAQTGREAAETIIEKLKA